MITVVNKKKPIHGGKSWLYEMSGESTDNKPSVLDGNTVGVNSLFLELDTKTLYYCAEEASDGSDAQWCEYGTAPTNSNNDQDN